MTGRRRVDHDQVVERLAAAARLLLEVPDLPERDQLAPAGRRVHQLAKARGLEDPAHQPPQPDLESQVLGERLVGVASASTAGPAQVAPLVARRARAGRGAREHLVPARLERAARGGRAGGRASERSRDTGLAGTALAGDDDEAAIEERKGQPGSGGCEATALQARESPRVDGALPGSGRAGRGSRRAPSASETPEDGRVRPNLANARGSTRPWSSSASTARRDSSSTTLADAGVRRARALLALQARVLRGAARGCRRRASAAAAEAADPGRAIRPVADGRPVARGLRPGRRVPRPRRTGSSTFRSPGGGRPASEENRWRSARSRQPRPRRRCRCRRRSRSHPGGALEDPSLALRRRAAPFESETWGSGDDLRDELFGTGDQGAPDGESASGTEPDAAADQLLGTSDGELGPEDEEPASLTETDAASGATGPQKQESLADSGAPRTGISSGHAGFAVAADPAPATARLAAPVRQVGSPNRSSSPRPPRAGRVGPSGSTRPSRSPVRCCWSRGSPARRRIARGSRAERAHDGARAAEPAGPPAASWRTCTQVRSGYSAQRSSTSRGARPCGLAAAARPAGRRGRGRRRGLVRACGDRRGAAGAQARGDRAAHARRDARAGAPEPLAGRAARADRDRRAPAGRRRDLEGRAGGRPAGAHPG